MTSCPTDLKHQRSLPSRFSSQSSSSPDSLFQPLLTSLSLFRIPSTLSYDVEFIHSPSSSDTVILNIHEIEHLLTVATEFPCLQTLQLTDVLNHRNTHLWTPITQAWSQSLLNLSIEDNSGQFDHNCLSILSRFQHLRRLVISSYAVRWITPLKHLTSLRELVLHNCTIHDHHVIPIISNMTHLHILDLTETFVTPNIVTYAPPSLVRFAGGDRDAYCEPDHIPAVQPGLPPINVRQATLLQQCQASDEDDLLSAPPSAYHRTLRKRIVTVQPKSLPNLKVLEWGEWKGQRQSAASLRLIAPQLDSLCLCGPDYDDEICEALVKTKRLKCLELFGCNITDVTAHILSQHPCLEFVNITDCERITPHGLHSICIGKSARTEILESVSFFGEIQTPSEALRDLVENHQDMLSDTDLSDQSESDPESDAEQEF